MVLGCLCTCTLTVRHRQTIFVPGLGPLFLLSIRLRFRLRRGFAMSSLTNLCQTLTQELPDLLGTLIYNLYTSPLWLKVYHLQPQGFLAALRAVVSALLALYRVCVRLLVRTRSTYF